MEETLYLIVNFGGPRNLREVEPFLKELLTDQDVIQTSLPSWIHRLLFRRVAKKRAITVAPDYEAIGGKSPIVEDTEAIVTSVKRLLHAPIFAFHRYLPATHSSFVQQMRALSGPKAIRVFPLFPQFTYATTGSIARWFAHNLPAPLVARMQWVKSYPAHPSYLSVFEKQIQDTLRNEGIQEEEILLLFSAHGLPQSYVDRGDPYEKECLKTFEGLKGAFPQALSRLCYQSQFGKEEWLRPYTIDCCKNIAEWGKGRCHALVVPLSFTSDHIETLFEIEKLYLPLIRKSGMRAYRCPALNRDPEWIEVIAQLMQCAEWVPNECLIRPNS